MSNIQNVKEIHSINVLCNWTLEEIDAAHIQSVIIENKVYWLISNEIYEIPGVTDFVKV